MTEKLKQIKQIILQFLSLGFLFVWASDTALQASPISVGVVSFDVQVPAQRQQLGVNVINISNFSGPSLLPPDFPITSPLILQNVNLTIFTPGGSQLIALGNLGPGDLPSTPSLQFASNFLINSVTLQATLSQTSIQANGLGYAASSASLLYVLLPSSGSSMQAGIDLGVFEIDASPTAVPEPSALTLAILGGFCLFLRGKGKRGLSSSLGILAVGGISVGLCSAQQQVNIVAFTDPQCAACQIVSKNIGEIQARYPGSVVVVTKRYSELVEEAKAFGVSRLPALFVNGNRIEGLVETETLSRIIDRALGKMVANELVTIDLTEAPRLGAQGLPEITVFSDFQCPYCASLSRVLSELANQGDAAIRFKHFPLSFHANSPGAHRAAIAAARQGKFWEMHDRIFAAQGKLNTAAFEEYAQRLGLEMERFRRDSAFDQDVVKRDLQDGERVGVEGTPSVFVNGRAFLGAPTLQNLRAALKGSGATSPTRELSPVILSGNANAPATVEWFFDAQSELTPASAAIVREFLKQNTDRVQVIARNLPMPYHPTSAFSHQALVLAQQQGRYWPFLDLLASRPNDVGSESMKGLAMRLGLDTGEFAKGLDAGVGASVVALDARRAQALGIRGVPTFVVNGVVLEGVPTVETLKAALSRTLNEVASASLGGASKR